MEESRSGLFWNWATQCFTCGDTVSGISDLLGIHQRGEEIQGRRFRPMHPQTRLPGREGPTQLPFWDWETSCVACGDKVTSFSVIICSNFGVNQGCWGSCHQGWCPKHYNPLPLDNYPILEPHDEEGTSWRKKKDEDRLKVGIKGVHLKIPFQCDECWFINLKDQRPIQTP